MRMRSDNQYKVLERMNPTGREEKDVAEIGHSLTVGRI
jgi:hypothetical protein